MARDDVHDERRNEMRNERNTAMATAVADPISDAIADAIAERAASADRSEGDLAPDIADLRRGGWLTACLPSDRGGQGWGCEPAGTQDAFDALRTVGRANLSVARLFEGHMNAVKLVFLYGSETLGDQVSDAVHDGALLGVWGADDRDGPLSATPTDTNGDSGLKLSGAKIFASGLGLVSLAVVTVPDSDRQQLLLVPCDEIDRADPSGWTMAGMRATHSGRYDFTGLNLPGDNALGEPGDYACEPYFEGGIWRYCAAHLGAAERLYEEMRDALFQRGRHEDAHQQRRIADAAIAIETARLWLVRAANEIEAEDADPGKAVLALLAREVTHDACRDVMATVQGALGMAAHVEGTAVERISRDLALFLCQAAPDAKRAKAAQALIAAKTLPEHL